MGVWKRTPRGDGKAAGLMDGDILNFVDCCEVWLASEMGREVVCELLKDRGKSGFWGWQSTVTASLAVALLWGAASSSACCWSCWWKICWSKASTLLNHMGLAIVINWIRLEKSIFIFQNGKLFLGQQAVPHLSCDLYSPTYLCYSVSVRMLSHSPISRLSSWL